MQFHCQIIQVGNLLKVEEDLLRLLRFRCSYICIFIVYIDPLLLVIKLNVYASTIKQLSKWYLLGLDANFVILFNTCTLTCLQRDFEPLMDISESRPWRCVRRFSSIDPQTWPTISLPWRWPRYQLWNFYRYTQFRAFPTSLRILIYLLEIINNDINASLRRIHIATETLEKDVAIYCSQWALFCTQLIREFPTQMI